MLKSMIIAGCAFAISIAQTTAGASGEIAADRNPVPLGQSVTLNWYFTGTKVVVSGGRFGAGAVVTGKTTLMDTPVKTTRYTFDVAYMGKGAAPAGQEAKIVPLHGRYSILVEVYDPKFLGLEFFTDPHGWRVAHMAGWKRDSVPLPDPANNALVYFQKEDDSIERLAVSILPVKDASPKTLLDRIRKDLPSHYEGAEMQPETDVVHEKEPAVLATFTGRDNSHPGVKTQTLLLTFIRGGLGYVISARTWADRFAAREPMLRRMVKSFMLDQPATRTTHTPAPPSVSPHGN